MNSGEASVNANPNDGPANQIVPISHGSMAMTADSVTRTVGVFGRAINELHSGFRGVIDHHEQVISEEFNKANGRLALLEEGTERVRQDAIALEYKRAEE